METQNEQNPKNNGNRTTPEERVTGDRNDQLKPKPEKDPEEKQKSGFMKIVGKVGYSVWLTVMIIGAGLAFAVALFLL